MRRSLTSSALLTGVLGVTAGCPSTTPPPYADMAAPTMDLTMPPPGAVLKRPSKSSTIAIADNDSVVAVVNSEDNSVSFFSPTDNSRKSKVTTGGSPSAVVIHPDNNTAFVANRADATVVKITGIGTASPVVSAPVSVGSEPTGLALSPTGAKLFVAEFAEGSVGVIGTAAMTRSTFASGLRAPRAVTVTNNGDSNDSDETVVIPEFFGAPVAGKEGKNDGREGRVRLYSVDGADKGAISLAAFTNSDATFETTTSPNQLYAAAVAGGRVYIPTVSASPALPLQSDKNVYPVVYVADLSSKQEVRSGAGTTNLAQLVNQLPAASGGAAATRWFLGEIVDLDFKPTTGIAYAVSRAAEVVQRIDYTGNATAIGSPQNKQIDVLGSGASSCQQPSGIVVANTLEKAFVNCWVTARLAVLDLTSQTVQTVIESAPAPAAGSADDQARKGRHFFFTGRGRWSGNGTGAADPTENGSAWSSCGTCHPDGLTDNITWIFGTGPRQTISMDGSFSHGPGAQKQRIFNWSAVIDEMHDFEANTRGTSGGKGAVTSSASCGTLSTETRSALSTAPMGAPVTKETQDSQTNNCVKDFDDINTYTKTIRPPRARRFGDAASVARGSDLFSNKGGCVKCHGGAGWTVSNRFYTPSAANNAAANSLLSQSFTKPTEYTAFASPNATQIAAQNMAADAAVAANVPPLQLTCALRSVDTFGVPGDTQATDALEIRAGTFAVGAGTSNRAQGRGGFNVPSLYGLALGAPYLHHGQAATLSDLFTDTKWQTHWKAGNPNFLTDAGAPQERADLIAFLLTIDAQQPEKALPAAGFGGGCQCRDGSAPPAGGCAP